MDSSTQLHTFCNHTVCIRQLSRSESMRYAPKLPKLSRVYRLVAHHQHLLELVLPPPPQPQLRAPLRRRFLPPPPPVTLHIETFLGSFAVRESCLLSMLHIQDFSDDKRKAKGCNVICAWSVNVVNPATSSNRTGDMCAAHLVRNQFCGSCVCKRQRCWEGCNRCSCNCCIRWPGTMQCITELQPESCDEVSSGDATPVEPTVHQLTYLHLQCHCMVF